MAGLTVQFLRFSALSAGSDNIYVRGTTIAVVLLFVLNRIMRARKSKKATPLPKRPLPAIVPNHPVILPPAGSTQPLQRARPALPIQSVRDLMGSVPRSFPRELQKYLHIEPPVWLKKSPDDEMHWVYGDQDKIRKQGKVIWASVVQANSLIFRPGPSDHGASVIFSLDPWFDSHANALPTLAAELFALKGTDQEDAHSAAFARMLTNEMTRAMMLPVPKRFTEGREVFHSSLMLVRKHLPIGRLTGKLLPVWIDPENRGKLLLVPAAYWPASLTAIWSRD